MAVKNRPGVIRRSSMDPGGEFLVWNGQGYTYEASKADAVDTAKAIWGKMYGVITSVRDVIISVFEITDNMSSNRYYL